MKTCLIALCGLMAAIFSLHADVPNLINYQGYVTDSNGLPIGAGAPVNRKIVFRVYDDANAGNRLWTEEHTVTLVEGQFSILLGAGIDATGTAAGEVRPALNGIFAGTGERYIGLTVDDGDNTINASDTEIAPRQRLTSTAFALRAKTADRVADGTDLYLQGDTNHGLGWYGSGRLFNGAATNGPVLYGFDGGVLGSAQGATQTTALTWESDGDVRISKDLATIGLNSTGNATIAGTLTMSSPIRMKGNALYLHSAEADNNHGLKFTNTYDGATIDGPTLFGFSGGVLGIASGGERRALQWSADGAAAKVIVNGKLGVGVEAPAKALEVNGEMSSTGNATIGGQISVAGTCSLSRVKSHSIHVENGDVNLNRLQGAYLEWNRDSGSGATSLLNDRGAGGGGTIFGEIINDVLYETMRITGNGSVGIGDSNPDAKLVVKGEIKATDKILANGKIVAVGEEQLRIVRGSIEGQQMSVAIGGGSGFTVEKRNGNWENYYVTFDSAFSGLPSVTATTNFTTPVDQANNTAIGAPADRVFCTVFNLSANGFIVRVLGDGGGSVGGFIGISFIAAGPR